MFMIRQYFRSIQVLEHNSEGKSSTNMRKYSYYVYLVSDANMMRNIFSICYFT